MADYKKLGETYKEQQAAAVMNYARKKEKAKPPTQSALHTPRGTLKEGAYLRAKDGDKIVHEDEIDGAIEHAEKEGDTEVANKLREAKKDIQTGSRGGQYYVGPSGKKIYLKDY